MALPALIFHFDMIRKESASFGEDSPNQKHLDKGSRDVITSEADSALLARLRDSDERALHEIFDTYLPALVRYADVTLGTDNGAGGDAGDIVSDVLTTLWERRQELQPIHNLRAYLYRAVRNRALNRRRSQRRIDHQHEYMSAEEGVFGRSRTEVPDIYFEHLEQQRLIWDTVRQMRPLLQQIAVLRWSHGLSFAEIAHITDLSENAARTYASRALGILRKTLPDVLK